MEGVRRKMIIGMVKAYESQKMIAGCLDSLQGQQIDRIIVADGYFPLPANYSYKYPIGNGSTDNTWNIVRQYRNVDWMPAPEQPYGSEPEKMNAMLDKVPSTEPLWLFWLDPDERLVGRIGDIVSGLGHEAEMLPVKVVEPNSQVYYIRVYRYRKGMKYDLFHTVKYPAGASVNLYCGPFPDKIWIKHCRDGPW
jgi:cellulose synthase/poly-beta-1,6-N-acetylglucosamine synthase-like glycosyltransferase